MPALAVRCLSVAIALAAALALFAETRDYGLLGFDTYPMIASARVDSLGDLTSLASEPLMAGRYPSPMYRPLVSALFALEYALFGLDAAGYQAVGAAAFCALLLALAVLGEQLGSRVGAPAARQLLPVLVPVLFALAPSYYEIVPVPARIGDLLCAAFCASAVAAGLAGRAGLAAAACAGAILSKETGFAAPALVAAGCLLVAGRDAVQRSLPSFSVAAILLGVRIAVLGGVGGHRDDLSLASSLASVPALGLELARDVALAPAAQTARAVVLGMVGLALALAACFGRAASQRDSARALARIAGFGVAWVGALALTYAAGGWIGAWYRMIPAIGIAIAVAALVVAAIAAALDRGERPVVRGASILALVGLLGAVALQAAHTPYFRRYGEWQRATDVAREFLGELDARVRASAKGSVVDAPPLPMWAAPPPETTGVLGAAILSDYSVQAWADLVHGDANVRVTGIEGGVLPIAAGDVRAAGDEIVVRLARRRVGY